MGKSCKIASDTSMSRNAGGKMARTRRSTVEAWLENGAAEALKARGPWCPWAARARGLQVPWDLGVRPVATHSIGVLGCLLSWLAVSALLLLALRPSSRCIKKKAAQIALQIAMKMAANGVTLGLSLEVFHRRPGRVWSRFWFVGLPRCLGGVLVASRFPLCASSGIL